MLIHLGLWQWNKGQAALARQASLEAHSHGEAQPMPLWPQPPEELRDRRFQLTGNYEETRQILVDNRVRQGVAGFYVITPFRLAGSQTRVLVNRGWVPAGAEHDRLPVVSAPPVRRVTITGIAVTPDSPDLSTGITLGPPENGWARVWPKLDWPRFQRDVAYPLQTVVIRLDADVPGGFERDWPRPDERAGMNLGYALQWFGFALAALGIWIWLLVRRRK